MSLSRIFLFLCFIVVVISLLPACRKDSKKGNGAAANAGAPPPPPPLPPPIEQPNSKIPPHLRNVPPHLLRRPVIAPITARNDALWFLAYRAKDNMGLICARGAKGAVQMAASVTHYYIPPGARVGDYNCRNGFAYFNQPDMAGTCMHPCRTLAAHPGLYRPGEVIFFPALVGVTCGSGRNKMIHDGFMVVADNGDPNAINFEGRFGTFWGRCKEEQNGFCLDDGAIAMDFVLTFSHYCRAWRPQDPLHHDDLKLEIYNHVRSEAARRGDGNAASSFDLDEWIGIGIDANGILFKRH